ncbi:MAG: hypothetical protein MJK10_15360 [Pseudomonadales bacterium]|nr:hypothetical protein [Pseudomonadales bacterium]NRA17619.1 hypothetical protein [Oceanospirillaceae bacterium]
MSRVICLNLSLLLALINSAILLLQTKHIAFLVNYSFSPLNGLVLIIGLLGVLLWYFSRRKAHNAQISTLAIYFNVAALGFFLIGGWFFIMLLVFLFGSKSGYVK